MIKIENTEVMGWEAAIRGMRNPMNSWEKNDSDFGCAEYNGHCYYCDRFGICDNEFHNYILGPNDHELMMKLAAGGPTHAKYRRMIVVYADITAPLYWWKEYDTHKVGTVANSCSTMHKIADKEFCKEDFSCEHLFPKYATIPKTEELFPGVTKTSFIHEKNNIPFLIMPDETEISPMDILSMTIDILNLYRSAYLETNDKKYWWQMIQLLPSSYNQKRTVMLNYEVLAGIYPMRKDHKLDEWHEFCAWIEKLPYSEIIIGNIKRGVVR